MPIFIIVLFMIFVFAIGLSILLEKHADKTFYIIGSLFITLVIMAFCWITIASLDFQSVPVEIKEHKIYSLDGVQIIEIKPGVIVNLTEEYKRVFSGKEVKFEHFKTTCDGIDFMKKEYKLVEDK